MRKFINFEDADMTRYGLSSAVVAGNFVFAGGMALDLDTLRREPEAATIADETRLCLDDLARKLEAAGCALKDLQKVNCYLTEDSYRTEFWATWDEIFEPLGARVVRLTQVAGIAGDCRVELDGVAVRPA